MDLTMAYSKHDETHECETIDHIESEMILSFLNWRVFYIISGNMQKSHQVL